MKFRYLMVPLILAVAVSPIVVAAQQDSDSPSAQATSAALGAIRGNPFRGHAFESKTFEYEKAEARPVAFSSFKGNPDRACARLAGHPPGRAQCRGLASRGGALLPMQAYSVSIPGFTGIVHYTSESDGLRVVASLAEEGGAPLRIVSTLAPETTMVLSVPRGVGEPATEIEMRRRGDFVVIRSAGTVPPPSPDTASRSEAAPEATTAPAPRVTNSGPHQRPLAVRNLD